MGNEVVYDTTSQPVEFSDLLSEEKNLGFSFAADLSNPGVLTDVKLGLEDPTPSDGGTISVDLYMRNANGSPGALLEHLGTIADSSVTSSPTIVDLPIGETVGLSTGESYYIELTSTTSSAKLDFEKDATGVGAVDQSYELTNGSFVDSNANGAYIAQVTESVACFASGSRIRTAYRDIAVEALHVGDLVVTVSGALRPVRWLGHRTIDCAAHARPSEVRPVRIRAGAFGGDLPERDLYLSPGHPVLVGGGADECLVPIMCLINGTTVDRVAVDEVTYWHVELDGHDILLAEGLPAESFFDLGSRPWFGGADDALYDPDLALPGMPGRCRPVAVDGPVVVAERRRLDLVFARRLAGACAWPSAQDTAFAM